MKPLALAPERRARLIVALDQLASEVPEERAAAGLEAAGVEFTNGDAPGVRLQEMQG